MPSVDDDLIYAVKPDIWAQECFGLVLDQWQKQVLDSYAPKILLNCSRQSGKSSMSALVGLHTAIYQPGALVLMVSHSLRQSGELFRKFLDYLVLLDNAPTKLEDTKLSLKLDNGSRVISLPDSEGTIRGFSAVNLLIVDEGARVLDGLYFALKPMLAVSRGRLLALSTPFGKRGWFFREWTEGQGWQRHMIKATECPRISKEFLEEEKRSMPKPWFDSEYMCEFTEPEDSVFGYDEVMNAISSEVKPLEV